MFQLLFNDKKGVSHVHCPNLSYSGCRFHFSNDIFHVQMMNLMMHCLTWNRNNLTWLHMYHDGHTKHWHAALVSDSVPLILVLVIRSIDDGVKVIVALTMFEAVVAAVAGAAET